MKDLLTVITNMRNRHYLVLDLIALLAIPALAMALRLDANFSFVRYQQGLLVYAVLSILIKVPIYYGLGLYRHFWRYASIEEVWTILLAVFTAGLAFNAAYLVLLPVFPQIPNTIPRSVPWIDLLLSFFFIGGSRLLSRIFTTELRKRSDTTSKGRKVLIVGAGNSGTMIAKEMLRNPAEGLRPVAFVDDDPRKQGVMINGIPVIGGRESIPEACRTHAVQLILIAMPSASGKSIRAVMQFVEPLKIPTKTLPGVSELMTDNVELRQFREVRIDDLLRRDPVRTDMGIVRSGLAGRTILVTGAGGSIGSELCRHIAQSHPARLIILGHGENSIHGIQRELQHQHPSLDIRAVIADIRDHARLHQIFEKHKPTHVYHAAAHKHVPLMEDNLVDALTNNVLGTINLLRVALAGGVTHFTLISTDKAVRPTSVMGMTKRMAEIAMQIAAPGDGRHFAAVRFGNVLGSRGSVIPIFLDQIRTGGPVTITHPEMRRFFMTIPEAVQLVLQASMLEGNGSVFVLDMGEPERILDLAIDIIHLSGYRPYKDIEIVFSGLRNGEKLNEELFREGETFRRSKHEKIFVAMDKNNGGCGIEESTRPQKATQYFETLDAYRTFIDQLQSLAHDDRVSILHRIATMIPECDIAAQAVALGLSVRDS